MKIKTFYKSHLRTRVVYIRRKSRKLASLTLLINDFPPATEKKTIAEKEQVTRSHHVRAPPDFDKGFTRYSELFLLVLFCAGIEVLLERRGSSTVVESSFLLFIQSLSLPRDRSGFCILNF